MNDSKQVDVMDGWLPLETIPRDGIRVHLLTATGELDFGNWYDFEDDHFAEENEWWTPSIPGVLTGDLSTDAGLGDYTHWKPIADASLAKELSRE